MVAEHADTLVAQKAPGPLVGEICPPGDKSISHRALILSSLAQGESRISGLLWARDVEATAQACRQLGVRIECDGEDCRVSGVGMNGLSEPEGPLDMGNSGTAMRLLAGVLAAQPFDSILTGDDSLLGRPMNRIAHPLRQMGAEILTRENGCAPLHIAGGRRLKGIRYRSPVASAQVKSCVLLAGLYATGKTSVIEPATSRDHTERMLRAFGADISKEAVVTGGSRLTAVDMDVPSDFSSAAFYIAAAVLVPESRLVVKNVGLNPTRSGLIDALRAMGCDVRVCGERKFGEEPVGDIEVGWRAGIKAVELAARDIPSIIDELPVLMVVAALADGVTRIRGAQELRVKESDRIAVMAAGLDTLGFRVRQYPDGMDIEGKPLETERRIGSPLDQESEMVVVDGAGDHRCAMSFCVLAQALGHPVEVRGAARIDTSFPTFLEDFTSLGARIRRHRETVDV